MANFPDYGGDDSVQLQIELVSSQDFWTRVTPKIYRFEKTQAGQMALTDRIWEGVTDEEMVQAVREALEYWLRGYDFSEISTDPKLGPRWKRNVQSFLEQLNRGKFQTGYVPDLAQKRLIFRIP